MNLPVIRLRAFGQKKEEVVVDASLTPFESLSAEHILVSGVNILFLAGLFSMVFGSTMFFIQKGGGEVFAQNIPGKYLASIGDVLGEERATTSSEILPVEIVLYKDPFENIQIEAKAGYVFDVASKKVLFEKNGDVQMPLASITKVMTALVASDILDDDAIITVETGDLVGEGGPMLSVGEHWRVKELLDFCLVTSSNDASGVLARASGETYRDESSSYTGNSAKEVFVKKMNEKAESIGMTGGMFRNESGLDVSTSKAGGYATPADVAMLYNFILTNKPTLLTATRQSNAQIVSADNIAHSAKNTNQDVTSFPGIMASKTGSTDLAGGNLSVVFDSGLSTPIIVVVLGSSSEGRFRDVWKLSQASREAVGQGVF